MSKHYPSVEDLFRGRKSVTIEELKDWREKRRKFEEGVTRLLDFVFSPTETSR
jgi:hypothetical protein